MVHCDVSMRFNVNISPWQKRFFIVRCSVMILNVFMYAFVLVLAPLSPENASSNRCSKEDATVIFRDAAIYNMTDAGHVWIVTEQALFSNNTPIGTLGLKLNNDNETEHIRVSCARILAVLMCRSGGWCRLHNLQLIVIVSPQSSLNIIC